MKAVHVGVPAVLADMGLQLSKAPVERAEPVVKQRLADYAAAVMAGAAEPGPRVLRRHVASITGPVPAPGGMTTPETAALAYGAAAHVLESDDTHQPSSAHPGSVIFSTLLPLAVERDLTIAEVGKAAVAGYEIMCRLGEAARPSEQYDRGFHPTGTCGVFGAAAAAVILLDGGRAAIERAIALSPACSSGSMAFLQGGGWSKLLNVGHAASVGITVARLALLGYEGPEESVTGPHGFLAGHTGRPNVEVLELLDVDEPWAIERTSVKAHGCCRYEQGPVDALLIARTRRPFTSQEVMRVEVGMIKGGWGIVAEPIEAKRRPATVVDSRFSMPFGAALAIVRGRVAAADHTVENLADADVQRVMDVVECFQDPELDAQFPDRWPTIVRVHLEDGTVLEERVEFPKGDPENPLSEDELVAKARSLVPESTADDAGDVAAMILECAPAETRAIDVLSQIQHVTDAAVEAAMAEVGLATLT